MLKKKSFTIVEIMVALVILGIFAALAVPNYMSIRERALNRAIKPILLMIRTAEKDYRMENGVYYPSGTTESSIANINTNLRLGLPVSASLRWSISLDASGAGFANATRTGAGADGRIWRIDFPGDANPTCTGGVPASNCL
jgi:prepilin-type N-terminal cleavage/methylation domain-containing protein